MGMRWEENVFALFDDLEMQAQGLHLQERVGEVDALAKAGYAEIDLASRVHASRDREVRLVLHDGTEVAGRLTRAGSGWVLLDAGSCEWLVSLGGVSVIEGLGVSSLPSALWPVVARLSVRSALRRISEVGGSCVMWLVGGRQVTGCLGRVGADFVELRSATAALVVPTEAISAVQSGR